MYFYIYLKFLFGMFFSFDEHSITGQISHKYHTDPLPVKDLFYSG